MELPVQQVPREGRRRVRRRGQLVALGRVVVGEEGDSVFVDALAEHRPADRSARLDRGQHHRVGFGDAPTLGFANPFAQQCKPTIVEPVDVEIGAAVALLGAVLLTHLPPGARCLVPPSRQRYSRSASAIGCPEFVGGGCDDDVMSSTASAGAVLVSPREHLEVLFEELAELTGQRNAIDGRIVEIVAEIDRDQLWGATGARSVPALVAWKTGCSPANAHTITTIAGRLKEFPRCAQGMREGRLSLDQVGVIAARAGEGSDEHYAQLAACAIGQSATHRGQAGTATRTRTSARARALDHHDHQRAGQLLPDHASPAMTPRSSTPPWRLIVMR